VRAFFRREGRNFDHPLLTYILSFTFSSFLLSLKEERRAVYVRNVSLVVILFLFHFSLSFLNGVCGRRRQGREIGRRREEGGV
jgi:hypothetical protein